MLFHHACIQLNKGLQGLGPIVSSKQCGRKQAHQALVFGLVLVCLFACCSGYQGYLAHGGQVVSYHKGTVSAHVYV